MPAHDGKMREAARVVSEQTIADALTIADSGLQGRAVAFALGLQKTRGANGMFDFGRAESVFQAQSSAFDQHHHLLNVLNGTVDLRTGGIRSHQRADRLTKLTPVAYDPATPCPRWRQFLDEIFEGDEQLIQFIKRGIGYSLTGFTREHVVFMLHGNGKNGKGRFVRQLMRLLGDAAQTISFSTLTADRAKQVGNTPELARLVGARLVVAGEPDEGVRLSESVVKALTGEDVIQVMAKYEDPFEYQPTYKIWLHCNFKPEIRGCDDGIWRRPRLIPFNQKFEGDRADTELDGKLDAEAAGILAWAVEGAVEWFRNGLGEAKSVRKATDAYREESDILGQWIADRVRRVKGAFAPSAEVFKSFDWWCSSSGVTHTWKPGTFTKALRARGEFLIGKAYVRGEEARGILDVELLWPQPEAEPGQTEPDKQGSGDKKDFEIPC